MEAKSPVTVLQEMMAKIGSMPVYDLIPNSSGATPQLFNFQVTCDGVTATGSGRSKKDAKHNAANAMLEKFSKRNDGATSTASDLLNSSFTSTEDLSQDKRHVQTLMRLCAQHKVPEPIFKELEIMGPDHARVFTVQCSVESFKVDGIGRSKKQAKDDAAKKMIEKIKDAHPSVFNGNRIQETKSLENSKSNIAIDPLYYQRRPWIDTTSLKIDGHLKVQSQREQLVKIFQKSMPAPLLKLNDMTKLIEKCQQNMNEENLLQVKNEFQSLLKAVKIDFHHMLLQTVEPVTFMLTIQLNTVPDIIEMSLGSTREETELRTIYKVIEVLKDLFQ